jgi:hypothetical protein
MKPFKFFQKREVILWTDAQGGRVRVNMLRRNHIHNIIRCLEGNGNRTIPRIYEGRNREEWLTIMNNELDRRDETI